MPTEESPEGPSAFPPDTQSPLSPPQQTGAQEVRGGDRLYHCVFEAFDWSGNQPPG